MERGRVNDLEAPVEMGKGKKAEDEEKHLVGPGALILLKGRVYLQSPFAMISFEARKYAAIQMEVPSWQIDSILLQTKEKLLMSITLYGKERYFARKYRVFLEEDGKRIEPSGVDVHKGVSSGLEDSEAPLRAAYNVAFPLEKINPNGQVTLIAVDPQGNETRFPFDLSKMR